MVGQENNPPAAAQPAPASTSSSEKPSNVPVPMDKPGKWMIWRTVFEIDEHYQPIKAIGKIISKTFFATRHFKKIKKVKHLFFLWVISCIFVS